MNKNKYILKGNKIPVYNHYQLNIPELSKRRPDIQLSVLRFSGDEALNTPWRYSIELTCETPDIPADVLINTTAELLFYPDGKPWEAVDPASCVVLLPLFSSVNELLISLVMWLCWKPAWRYYVIA